MKWPEQLVIVRHDVSAYNILKDQKKSDTLYQAFLAAFAADPEGSETQRLAREVQKRWALGKSDCGTPLAPGEEGARAEKTGRALRELFELPDAIFVSPFKRTHATLDGLKNGWPELKNVRAYEEERIREQDHGLVGLYNDWKVFAALHPEQRLFYELQGQYWYRYPQGEDMADVRERNRSWFGALIRDFAEKRVWAITHHLNILAIRANLERLGTKEFLRLDREEKPVNCGVTVYRGNPRAGRNGRLELEFYNRKFY